MGPIFHDWSGFCEEHEGKTQGKSREEHSNRQYAITRVLNPHTSYTTVLFEVISAFGTVGLSMNFTTDYGTVTKIIIIVTMLIGKIGILTFVQLFISEKKQLFHYAKDNVQL